MCLTQPGQAGCGGDLSSFLHEHEMLKGDLATLATIRQRKCSHRVCNPSAAEQHRNERGRAFLFPGIYLRVPQAPRCGQAECDNIPEEAGERVVPWGDLVIVAAEFKTEIQEQAELIQPLWQIRQMLSQVPDQGAGILLASSKVAPGAAPRPGGGRESGAGGTVLETSTPVPPCSSVRTLGGFLVPSTTDTLTFCWRKAEGERENTNNEELVRDEEVWVNPASYHSSARGHGYPSAAIWWLHFWGIPLFLTSLCWNICPSLGETFRQEHGTVWRAGPALSREMQITPCPAACETSKYNALKHKPLWSISRPLNLHPSKLF